jgi:hypothetical protein
MRRSLTRSFVAVLTLLAMLGQGTLVLAGTTGQVAGTITDAQSAQPISGATISVSSPSQSASTTSDAQGRFGFLSLAPDTYSVTIVKSGYQTFTQPGVTVIADQTATLSYPVYKTLATIGKTTARASTDVVRPGTVQDVYAVNAAQAETVQALGGGGNFNTAYAALASVPGVVLPYGGNGSQGQVIFIHGASYSQVGYDFDGVPVNRAFDNYNANSLSNLGQQELQVITSGSSASSSTATVAGLISQVIRTGTSPGFRTLNFQLGDPTSYHSGQIEVGGASPNRNFSYYGGLLRWDQSDRYFDQFNGGLSLGEPGSVRTVTYVTNTLNNPGIFPACIVNRAKGTATNPFTLAPGTPGAIAAGTGGDPGCALYDNFPQQLGGFAGTHDTEGVINLHFGIPRRSGFKDDVQFLYSGSTVTSKIYDSLNDYGIGLVDAIMPFSAASPPTWHDGYVFPANTAFGTPAAGVTAVPYFFPNSPGGRAFNAPLPADVRGGITNDAQIIKLQYQRNWEHAYLRAYGYSFFSDWLQNNPVYGALGAYTFEATASRDYELITHTHGGGIQLADQLSNQHQLVATLNYSTAKPTRSNNTTFLNALTTTATNYTDGTNCYRIATGAVNSCYSGTTSGTYGNPTPALGAGVAVPGASFIVTDPGPRSTYNAVVPKFVTASLTDDWRPNDKTVVNFGVRLERFEYDRPSTDSADYKFWFNQVANTYCYNLRTGQPLVDPFPPQFGVGNPPALHSGFNNTCGPVGPGPTGHVDPSTGDPVGNPNGQFGTIAFSGISSGTLTRSVFEPRIGATFTVNPDTVLRGSAGIYSVPFNTATVQYLNLSPKSAATFDFQNFFGFGFNTPTHDFDPTRSYNIDASLEKRIKGTDMSYKVSPFYRYVQNQYQDFLIGPGFVSSIPTGNETAYGVEFQFRKGDPSRNGLSEQLSYTYTNAFFKLRRLQNGSTVLTPVNGTIDQFNALTSTGSKSGQKGAPCYVGGAPAPAGMCTASGGANNTPALTAAGAAYTDANGNQVVINPYYNVAAQPYYNEGAAFPVYQTFPSVNGARGGVDAGESIVEPHAFSGFVNWKKDRFSAALAGTMTVGAAGNNGFSRYGNPYTVVGVDPRTCSNNQTNVPTAPNPGQPNYISCLPSLGQFGSLYVPNPQTGRFDDLAEFRQPWLLNLNAQMSYALSSRVRATVVLANVFNRCFGGSKTPWTNALGAGRGCSYTPNSSYYSNFYNGSGPNDIAANGVAAPLANQQSYYPTYPFSPFQATLQVQVKL